jgi:RNA polymerase sigma-70 factor (ECF subfamily)
MRFTGRSVVGAQKTARAESSSNVTKILAAWNEGQQGALERLMPFVYAELRRVARNQLRREAPGHTLQPTALVNEAYVRLVGIKRLKWQGRTHFFAMCARLMRQLLVDAARARRVAKRGGSRVRVTLRDDLVAAGAPEPEILALDEALDALQQMDARKAQVVELRFFAGLSLEETALVLGVSSDTVMRDWKFAKTWLYRELRGERPAAR